MNGGALAYSARHALVMLTGHDYFLIEDWRNFWEGNKESLDPKTLGEEEDGDGICARITSGLTLPKGEYIISALFLGSSIGRATGC